MKAALALILLVACVANAGVVRRSSLFDKIVGGYVVETASHKYQVHLKLQKLYYGIFPVTGGCGASIISPKWILTAAHCIVDFDGSVLAPAKITVRTGQHDASVLESHAKNHKAIRVIKHEGYDEPTFLNDIALIELESEIVFDTHTGAVSLPSNGYTPADGVDTYVTGWGTTSAQGSASNLLLAAVVQVVNKNTCNTQYSGGIKAGMLCASAPGKDSCQGDSGGPLVEVSAAGVHTQVGVVSFGYGCAHPEYAGVYANVGEHIQWIQQKSGLVL